MKTTETTQSNLSTDLLRRLALMQHLGEDFFIVDGIAYEGNEDDNKAEYQSYLDDAIEGEESVLTYNEWIKDNCSEIEELEENDYTIDYMVLTDDEADKKAKDYIIDSLWAFNPSFLADETGLPYEVFKAIADNGKCESNNDAIEKIINKTTDIDSFVQSAISADGRGHFLSMYDGNENEETVKIYGDGDMANQTFYIYRTN